MYQFYIIVTLHKSQQIRSFVQYDRFGHNVRCHMTVLAAAHHVMRHVITVSQWRPKRSAAHKDLHRAENVLANHYVAAEAQSTRELRQTAV